MSEILSKLEKVGDGRSHALGEKSGKGYLGGVAEYPVMSRRPRHLGMARAPERDTQNSYAYRASISSYILVSKSSVDKTA